MLAAAIKSDELAVEAKYLRMEMEDVGTTGDGDNKPEAFVKQWEVRFGNLMNAYAELLEGCDGACLLYTSPSPRDQRGSRMPSSA